MKFGTLQSVLEATLDDVFPIAAKLGFDGVELDWNDPADAQPGGPLAHERREALRSAARSAGVEIASVAAHFLNHGGLASAEHERMGVAAVQEGIRLCQDLGAQVLLVPFFSQGDIIGQEGIERLTRNLNVLAPEAELARVTLGVESMLPAHEVVALLDAVGSPFVGAYFDMANGMGLGYDPVKEVETLGRHIVQVHAKEFVAGDGPAGSRQNPRFDFLNKRPFGEGGVPVREIFQALHRAGYDGYIVLETGAFGDPQASARAALDVLRSQTGTPAA
jgi:hexulose-6-phosphate isomerase